MFLNRTNHAGAFAEYSSTGPITPACSQNVPQPGQSHRPNTSTDADTNTDAYTYNKLDTDTNT
eukprot:995002-Pyramimonas_sp.AAC.2